jgi:hypothetical protein
MSTTILALAACVLVAIASTPRVGAVVAAAFVLFVALAIAATPLLLEERDGDEVLP